MALDRVVSIDGKRGLYVRCTGSGSPTVVMEGGDEDTSSSYAYAEPSISKVARTCVYDRANLGRSDPASGPRPPDLVSDLEGLLRAAEVPGPYVLVGTSGGGYITAGYAYEHPDEIAGMVFVDAPPPFPNPPRDLVEATDPSDPSTSRAGTTFKSSRTPGRLARDRRHSGHHHQQRVLPRRLSRHRSPRRPQGCATTSERQKGWLVFSPRAKQVVVHTGHAVEEADPRLVIDAILAAVENAG